MVITAIRMPPVQILSGALHVPVTRDTPEVVFLAVISMNVQSKRIIATPMLFVQMP